MQELAFVDDHVNVLKAPVAILDGDAESAEVTVPDPLAMVTVAYFTALDPPGPVQLIEYVVVVEGDTATDPEVALPVANVALLQEVAFVEVQVRLELEPAGILAGAAENVTSAAGVLQVSTHTVAVFTVVPFPFVQLYV